MGVGGSGVLDFLQNTNDPAAAWSNSHYFENSEQMRPESGRQLDRRMFEFPLL